MGFLRFFGSEKPAELVGRGCYDLLFGFFETYGFACYFGKFIRYLDMGLPDKSCRFGK